MSKKKQSRAPIPPSNFLLPPLLVCSSFFTSFLPPPFLYPTHALLLFWFHPLLRCLIGGWKDLGRRYRQWMNTLMCFCLPTLYQCLHVYMWVCGCERIYAHVHICIHTHTHTQMQTYIHRYMYTYMHAYINTHIHTHTHTHTYIYLHLHMHQRTLVEQPARVSSSFGCCHRNFGLKFFSLSLSLSPWRARCLLITKSPAAPCDYRYPVCVLYYIPYVGLNGVQFCDCSCCCVYCDYEFWNPCFQRFWSRSCICIQLAIFVLFGGHRGLSLWIIIVSFCYLLLYFWGGLVGWGRGNLTMSVYVTCLSLVPRQFRSLECQLDLGV